ncbi:MAG: rhomboid family intramembrane serine protease [Gemmatimonadetes bacterium]|nr:rhomboid family intramembrane serine protease [Gemmatimonadota bacterium]
MIPLSDEHESIRTPVVTIGLIAVTVLVWVFVQGAGLNPITLAASVCDYGMVPGELTRRVPVGLGIPMGHGLACVIDDQAINWFTPVIAIFLHGSWGHLLGNLLFLWVFGNNVEDSMGRGRYLAFYLVCGLIAAAAQVASGPRSPVPTVGASGAISGIMGAYLVLYPMVRVNMLFILFIVPVRAWLVLVYWFLLQLAEAFAELGPLRSEVSSGVAVWAHVGGFVAGVVLVKFFVDEVRVEQRTTGTHPVIAG